MTQNGRDEPPFHNEYWDNKEEGIYVDIVSGGSRSRKKGIRGL
ncbi:hypothetical protein [Paenibacillus sp. R14(2021)]